MMKPLVALTLLMVISTACDQQAEIVTTTLGRIQGLRKTVDGKTVDVYYGIPFAKPPVRKLRFKRPQPAEPWTDVRSTVTKPNACVQTIDTAFDRFPGVEMWNPNTPVSEDCLYLNVWVPRQSGSQSPLTTMVWIYGGGLTTGSSALDVYDASKLSTTQNVIVASMNYRLGPLGFLYTGTLDAPGNQGMLDQSLALKWIYNNVVSFGGRQDDITIFGESAGAFSVGLHILSPMSNNYFTRAIMQSGSPFQNMLFMSTAMGKERSQKLARVLQCPDHPPPTMLQCLRKVSAQNVTDNQYAVVSGNYIDIPMRAVVDGYFLPDTPARLADHGTAKKTEILIGINENEGFYFLLYAFPKLFPLQPTSNISDTQFKELMRALTFYGNDSVTKAVTYEYVDKLVPANRPSYRDIADDVCGDHLISCPTLDFASTFAALEGGHHDVYLYSFEHNLSNNPWPDYMGVMHGYEIEPVFGLPLPFNYTQAELDLADRMMGYWTRFAQTGNPNGGGAVLWPKLTAQEAQYLKMTAQGDSVGQGLRRQHCTFRSTILPLLKSVKESSECPAATGSSSARPFRYVGVVCATVMVFLLNVF